MTQSLELTFKIDELEQSPASYNLEANEAERASLKERFGLVSLSSLKAEGKITHNGEGQGVLVKGMIEAELEQQCTVSLKPVGETIKEEFSLLLVEPAMADRMDEDEAYLDESAPDYDALEGDTIDVGEIVAQTLSITMNPYPRADDANLEGHGKQNVQINEAELERPNPFAELAKLKDKS